MLDAMEFQSTGPLRDPTAEMEQARRKAEFQSTGPLRDPTNRAALQMTVDECISIHRSLAGPDLVSYIVAPLIRISIHRSLAGPD